MAIRVFVYGTLKRGRINHYLMRGDQGGVARLLAEGRLVKPHPMIVVTEGFTFPYLMPAMEGRGKHVTGELYEVDDDMLKILDKLEGHPNWYLRTPTQITITNPLDSSKLAVGDTVDCSVYIMCKEHVTEEYLSKPYVETFQV